jgi:hypothetical protein
MLSYSRMADQFCVCEVVALPGDAQRGLQQSSMVVVRYELPLDASAALYTVGSARDCFRR